MKDNKPSDIAKEEDLFFGVMNLVSIEEHLVFTAMKTGKSEYIGVLNSIRELRKFFMKKLLKNTEGEMWCISKHLISSIMRLMETGAKYLDSNKEASVKFYKSAFDLYTIFWFLQKMKDGEHAKKIGKKNG